jgi:hypothetical protein
LASAPVVEPYGLAPAFERAVVWLCCCRPRFWGRVGHQVDPAHLETTSAKLAVKAAQAIAKDQEGKGSASTTLVIQRLRRWMTEGKVSKEQLDAVCDMFDLAEDECAEDLEEAVITEIVPLLRRRMAQNALRLGMGAFTNDTSIAPVIDLFSKAERLGIQNASPGTKFGADTIDKLKALDKIERLKTGIPLLDHALDGGMMRGQLGVVGAPFGGGKSLFLTQVAVTAIWGGKTVAYATLELSEDQQQARLMANLVDLPINDLSGKRSEEAKRIYEIHAHHLGDIYFRHFAAQVTTVEDLREWVTIIEANGGKAVDVILVDYADKMVSANTKEKDTSGYLGMRDVYEGLRVWVEARNGWCWTATQLKRKESKSKKARSDGDDVADSIHKSRVTDILITLNPDEEVSEIAYWIAKNRTGRSLFGTPPIPVNFACGRIAAQPERPEDDL